MKIVSQIRVGNNVSLGIDSVDAETNCFGFITIKIPLKDSKIEIELSRQDLREFLARTCPEFVTEERYKAEVKTG